jgi:hypothetical protein
MRALGVIESPLAPDPGALRTNEHPRRAMRRAGLIAIGGLLLLAIAARSWLYADVVRRHSELIDDLPPYGDELRQVPPYGDTHAQDGSYSGPGWYPTRSPDGRRVAVTISWSAPISVGLITDRPFLHTVAVWDHARQRLQPVVSIMEADPHSGIAHRYTWSQDSRALLIHGLGRLPENYEDLLELCVVYLPEKDALYRLRNCPPAWQRGPRASGSEGP